MNEDISKQVLEKIKDVSPKSKFSFLAQNYVFWFASIVSVVVGAIIVAVMLFILINQDWDLSNRVGGFAKTLVYVLPYFWILIFTFFVIIAYYEVKHVEGGYRVALPVIISSYIVLTCGLGFGLYKIGVGDSIERGFVAHAPLYRHMIVPRQELWHDPEMGLIMGRIVIITTSTLDIEDLRQELWNVDTRNASKPHFIELEPGMFVKIIGKPTGNFMFEAEIIRPERMPHPMMMKEMKEIKRNTR